MKNCLVRLAVLAGLVVSLFAAISPAFAGFPAYASIAVPSPPAENPNPPQSVEDKRRVSFAEQVIQAQLQNITTLNADPGASSPSFQNKDLACLQTPACYGKDLAYIQELKQLQDTYGQAVEVRHAHIIPWSFQKFLQQRSAANASPVTAKVVAGSPVGSMPTPQVKADEYMIHAYVRFSKNGNWNHLDVIITEDASGNLAFRHFFTVPMPYDVGHMPPGVVC